MEHSATESTPEPLRRFFPRGFGKAVIGSSIIRVAGAAFAFLVGIQLARYLGVENYGIYALYMTGVSLIAIFSQFGLAPLAVREVAKFPGSLTTKFQIVWFVKRAMLATMIVCILASIFIENFFTHPLLQNKQAVYAALFLAVAINLTGILGAILRGAQRVLRGQLSDMALKPALFSLLLIVAWYFSESLSPATALTLHLCAAITALALSVLFTHRLYSSSNSTKKEWKTNGVGSAAFPIWMSDLIRAVNAAYPLIVLAVLYTDKGVGIYKVAISCAVILNVPTATLNIAAGPYLARLHASGDFQALQRLHAGIGRMLLLAMILVTIVIWSFGADLIALAFGEQFRDAAIPLLVLAISQVVIAFFGISATFMVIAGGQKYAFYAFAISVSLAIIASTLLVPAYGVIGMAYAELLMVLIWHTLVWVLCRWKYGYDLSVFGASHLRSM